MRLITTLVAILIVISVDKISAQSKDEYTSSARAAYGFTDASSSHSKYKNNLEKHKKPETAKHKAKKKKNEPKAKTTKPVKEKKALYRKRNNWAI